MVGHQFRGRRVLFLQGPVGPFFYRLHRDLEDAGAYCFKVNFNGGDWLFSPGGSFNFRKKAEEWPSYFENLIQTLDIDFVIAFGDCRPHHRQAIEICKLKEIQVCVFEEGYIRPNYITFEENGVNGFSHISRSPIFYLNHAFPKPPEPKPIPNAFWHAAGWAIVYYIAAALMRPRYRHYQHHRPLSLSEAFPWLRSFVRKALYKFKERKIEGKLTGDLSKRFFLVPLQIQTDAQVQVHSEVKSVPTFIKEVIESFARHARTTDYLVIKHHPLDRGYCDYTALIRREARKWNASARVLYIHDQHLPTLLNHAVGVVVINSTVGLSALHHGVPTKVMGHAIYDMPGLTISVPLDEFWLRARGFEVDKKLYSAFCNYIVAQTQINGNFYRPFDIPGSRTGILWPEGIHKNWKPIGYQKSPREAVAD